MSQGKETYATAHTRAKQLLTIMNIGANGAFHRQPCVQKRYCAPHLLFWTIVVTICTVIAAEIRERTSKAEMRTREHRQQTIIMTESMYSPIKTKRTTRNGFPSRASVGADEEVGIQELFNTTRESGPS